MLPGVPYAIAVPFARGLLLCGFYSALCKVFLYILGLKIRRPLCNGKETTIADFMSYTTETLRTTFAAVVSRASIVVMVISIHRLC